MKVKILLIAMVIIGCGAAFVSNQSEAASAEISAETEAAILASTVQMAMYEYNNNGGRGLGTVVAYGAERLIITHDHWAHLTANLNVVEFRNSQGQLLVTLDAKAFRALILYRDGGTMMLRVPMGLESITAAEMGTAVSGTDKVWVTRRDVATNRLTVEVFPASVTALETGEGPAKMRLEILAEGAVIPGDSGGGVWADGRLIANNWSSVVVEKEGLLSGLFGVEQAEPTGLIIAALQPLGSQIGISEPVEKGIQSGSTELAGDGALEVLKDGMLQGTLLVD